MTPLWSCQKPAECRSPSGCTRTRLKGQPVDNSGRLEVERAAKFIRTAATGKTITRVETAEDTIVYTGGITHEQFAGSIAISPILRL